MWPWGWHATGAEQAWRSFSIGCVRRSAEVPPSPLKRCRYALLYLYGGIYMDLDVECTHSLDFVRAYPLILPATRPVGFSNDFMAARPGHPFMRRLVDRLPAWNLWLLTKYRPSCSPRGPCLSRCR